MTTYDDQPHSAQFLTDARDLWWHDDYLRLVAARVGLERVRRALDVGSGQGHWTRTIARLLAPDATITGVEREAAWIEKGRAAPPVAGAAVDYVQGIAERLPFPDATFDLVTCQTLLIHTADPRAVLREMGRVLKPGGALLCAEPNNIAQQAAPYVATADFDVEEVVAALRLELYCEKGKAALGLGYNSLGEGLVALIDPALFCDVRAWINDRCRVVAPPYTPEARRAMADDRRMHDEGCVGWPYAEQRRYYEAGGGDPAAFDDLWARARRLNERRFDAFDAGTYAAAEGGTFYVVAATRNATT